VEIFHLLEQSPIVSDFEILEFRTWDDAPHHRHLTTFPYHKHIKDQVVESLSTGLPQVLQEIAILQQ
jgi:hypothetical protein